MSLYEIHISVHLTTGADEIAWLYFCRENNLHNIKVYNVRGVHNVQTMLSKWCNRSNHEEAIKTACELEKTVEKAGFTVVRTKVESMMMDSVNDSIVLNGRDDLYWEYHFKIPLRDEFLILKNLLEHEHNVGLSHSAYSKSGFPIVTVREKFGNRKDVIKLKDRLISLLKEKGFSVYDKIQSEISIYDTNPKLDEGWINY